VSRVLCIPRPGVSAKLAARVLGVLEKYSLRHRNDLHTVRPIELLRQAGLVYEGQLGASTEMTSATGLTVSQLRLVQEMCEDAQACVTAGIETCRTCDKGLCSTHLYALARAESYRALAAQLGADCAATPCTLVNS
jgi:hypothetical protein